jgi:TonB-linked SusC/RagA family outer membrane protein
MAQEVNVRGTVTDQTKNEALSGVSVQVKGTQRGTTTDSLGKFSIMVPSRKAILTFNYVGYAGQEQTVSGKGTVNISLSPTTASLNEVVVVGYGTQKRKDITGSVVSLDRQRLDNLPSSNFYQSLEGALPGVTVTQTSSSAQGNNMTIQIRGKNSITASNDPLIILDGIPYNGLISDITPSDIGSIDVLKDASAAAIYGSRGSNGVILITTVKGKNGKPVITYDGFAGIQKIAHLPTLLSPTEFYAFKQYREPGSITPSEQAVYDSKKFPNWLGLGTRTGARDQHSVSIRGGNTNTKYFLSLTYLDSKGVAVNDHFRRGSVRINLETNITPWLSFGTNTQLNYDDNSGLPATFGGPGTAGVFYMNPLTTAFDSLGKPTIYPWPDDVSFGNPLAPTLANNQNNRYKVFSNDYLLVKLPFIPGLSYRLNTGVEYQSSVNNTYYGRNTRTGVQNGGSYTGSTSTQRNLTLENLLNYDHTFGKHSIGFTGLYSYEMDNTQGTTLAAQTFPDDILTYYQANVALSVQPGASYVKTVLVSQMARINYGYDSRYLLTLTGRRDGYSGFGVDDKYGFFPSVAAGWNIINEKFMANNKVVSNLKLRLSYGSNGNQAVDPYQTLARLSTRSYVDSTSTAPGYLPTTLATPDLHWETTNTANIGFDFGFFGGRLQGTIDAYSAHTHDLLLTRQISSVEGVSTILQNIGKTANKGMELGLTSINMKDRDFTWTSSGNISFNRNKVVELYGDGKNDTASQWFIGHPIDVSFGYVFNGVWQTKDNLSASPQPGVQPGYAKIKDLNHDGVIDSRDRTILGSLQPKFIWGLGNTFKYRNVSLYIFLQGVQGIEQPNPLFTDNVNSGVRYNTLKKNWWTPTNPTNDYWANALGANTFGAQILQNKSFLRVKDINLSYDFSPRILRSARLDKLKLYLEVRNAFTFTKWTGLDPELSDQGGIPLQREYVLGLNVSL